MEVVQSIGAPLDGGFRELRLQEVDKRSCTIDRGLGVLPQPPAQTCCSTQMALFMRIGASQFGNWPYSFQSAMVAVAIIDALGYSTVCARWVPRSLTTEHRRQRKAICSELLECFDAEGGGCFLSRIVTGDKTWAHHYELEMKRQSLEWHHPQSPRKKKFKTTPSAGKVMITIFWDIDGSDSGGCDGQR